MGGVHTRIEGTTVVVRIPMRFQHRGSRKRIVAPDGSAIVPTLKPQPDGGEGGNGQCARMRRHVDAVGKERHRAEDGPRHDLRDHHGRGQSNHGPCLPFVAPVVSPEEDMVMLPFFDRPGVHQNRSVTGIS